MYRDVFSKNVCLPVPVNLASLFVTYLHSHVHLVPSTIATYLSAVSFVHKLNQFEDPCANFVVQKLLHACYKQPNKKALCRLPITLPLLYKLLRALPHVEPVLSKQLMYKAMFLVAFHACCRVGEITKSGQAQHWLTMENISLTPASFTVAFTSFKHSKPGYTPKITVHSQQHEFCPVKALQGYLMSRGSQPGPLFCLADNLPISRQSFTKVLNQCVSFVGLDASKLTSHSFRIGRTTLGMEQGQTTEQLRLMGRWSSDAFRKYLKPSEMHL